MTSTTITSLTQTWVSFFCVIYQHHVHFSSLNVVIFMISVQYTQSVVSLQSWAQLLSRRASPAQNHLGCFSSWEQPFKRRTSTTRWQGVIIKAAIFGKTVIRKSTWYFNLVFQDIKIKYNFAVSRLAVRKWTDNHWTNNLIKATC